MERPSRRPLDNRPATNYTPSTYSQQRAAIIALYAAKIAAARTTAPGDQLATIIAAIRSEEQAALRALRDKAASEAAARQQRAILGESYRIAARNVTIKGSDDPDRPSEPRSTVGRASSKLQRS